MPTIAQRLETATTTLEGLVDNTTGTGDMVLKTSPTLVTPILGVASATSLTTSGSVTVGTTLTIATYTLALGGNVSFGATGRSLAGAANVDAAFVALGFTSSTFANFAGTITAQTAIFTYGSVTDSSCPVHDGTITTENADKLVLVQGNGKLKAGAAGSTLATLAGSETLTNKTLTSPVISSVVTVSNGNLVLSPNGTGQVRVNNTTGGLVFPSTATKGIVFHGVADETTNTQTGTIKMASNYWEFDGTRAGSGTQPGIWIHNISQGIIVENGQRSTGGMALSTVTGSTANAVGFFFTFGGSSASSGTTSAIRGTATYNSSGTAGHTDLFFNRTETALGSGAQLLFDFQVGGVSRCSLTNKGVFLPTGAVVLPAYTVATLPATAALGMVAGAMVRVTDALAPSWNVALVGGGAIHCGAIYNGAAWVAC